MQKRTQCLEEGASLKAHRNKLTANYKKMHRSAMRWTSLADRDGHHEVITRPGDVEERVGMSVVPSVREERLLDCRAEAAATHWDQAHLGGGRFGWCPRCWRGRIFNLRMAMASAFKHNTCS